MTDHKFTDAEIVKALECHIKRQCWNDCPNATEKRQLLNKPCSQMIAEDALDLINRQKAELDDLREIVFMDRSEAIKNLKAEAIKEFAQRLTSKLNCIPQHHFMLAQVLWDIDNLVKEMTGGR